MKPFFLSCLIFLSMPSVLAAPAVNDLDDLAVDEQDLPTVISPSVTVTGGNDFVDGSIVFSLNDSTPFDQFSILSDTDINATGAISADETDIYLGNGAGRDRIGSIDAINNGKSGADLTILFSSPLANSSFETGSTEGWTTFEQKFPNTQDLDGDAINWVNSRSNTSGVGSVNAAPTDNITYTIQTVTSPVSKGTYSLQLLSRGSVSCSTPRSGQQPDGYCSTHGPYVESTPFDAFVGDRIFLDWSAQNGGDWYEVFGYIIGDGADDTFGTSDDTETLIFSQRGDSTEFATSSTTINNEDTYLFRFISGTYDASGGLAVGASLYVDNVRVIGSTAVTDTVVLDIMQRIQFENTSDAPPASRTLNVSLTAGDGSQTNATSLININGINDGPVITSHNANNIVSLRFDEGITAVTTITATDVDSTPTFAITGGFESSFFSIDATNGGLRFIAPADFETRSLYEVEVTAQDNDKSDTQAFSITLNNLNDNTPTINSNGGQSMVSLTPNENQQLLATLRASDLDGDNIVYSITGGSDANAFEIDASGEIRFLSPPNAEEKTNYMLVAQASDGTNSSSQTFNITVNDMNEFMPAISSNNAANTVQLVIPENTTAIADIDASDADLTSSISYSLLGDNTRAFSLNAQTGLLAFNSPQDRETAESYTVTVRATDGTFFDDQTLVITIGDENDNAPVFVTQPALSVNENQQDVVMVAATDADLNSILTYSLSGADANAFTIDSQTGVLRFVFAPNFEVQSVYNLNVIVSDGQNTTTQATTVTVNDINEAPVITGESHFNMLEGEVGLYQPVFSDQDNSAMLAFSLNTQAPDFLTIDAQTGLIIATPEAPDVGNYDITITVNDGEFTQNQSVAVVVLPDLDRDGITDLQDSDIDGDALPNEWELANGLNAFNASDAVIDTDADGISNLEEFTSQRNPNIDDVAPVIVTPDNLIVNSTELFTQVELGEATASDFVDGAVSVAPTSTSTTASTNRFKPGQNTITWQASDAAGNVAQTQQIVNVVPMVQFSRSQTVDERGSPTISIGLHLNGNAVTYPVIVDFTVSGTATAPDDHTLTSQQAIFESGTYTDIIFTLNEDDMIEGEEQIILTINNVTNAVVGSLDTHIVTIVEQNVSPRVTISATQNNEPRSIITRDGGMVTIQATVVDPNSMDAHTYDWTTMLSSDLTQTTSSFTFDPSDITSDTITIALDAVDNGAPMLTGSDSLVLAIIDTAPTLSMTIDSDNDGISDAQEGMQDDDGDGVPNFADALTARNVLQEVASENNRFILETNAGLTLQLGEMAIKANTYGASIRSDMFNTPDLPSDFVSNIGGYFDFEVSNLPVTGQSVNIVIPQINAIPMQPIYRKFQNGMWNSFVETANDSIASAMGAEGFCPPPGDDSYSAGLTPGHWCVQLTIEDGGPNDADGVANNTVVDPGGVGSQTTDQATVTSGGGAFPLSLLLSLFATLVLRHYRILTALVISCAAVSTQANVFKKDLTLGLSIYKVKSNDAERKAINRLDNAGFDNNNVTIDASRAAWQITAEKNIYMGLYAELGYLNLGESTTRFSSTVSTPSDLETAGALAQSQSAEGITIGIGYKYMFLPKWGAAAKAGFFTWKESNDFDSANLSSSTDDDGIDSYLGAELHYQIDRNITMALKYQTVKFDNDNVNGFGIGLRYSFK